ncbi:MAG: mycothiol synthase [Dehalococcoidia bacterium]
MERIVTVSQLDPAHLEQLRELIEAATRADGHEPLGEHKFLHLQRGSDLGSAVLAFDGERLSGYAHTLTFGEDDERRASCEFVVHPDVRRKGIGSALLSRAIDVARVQDARSMDLWSYNDTAAGARIAAHFGFEPARRLLHLHRHVRSVIGAPAPEGASLRAFRPGRDEEAWLTLNNRIFAGHPENGRWTIEDLRARMAQPWFNPHDVLMLEADGRLAGFCWLKVGERPGEGRVGEIYVIGTAPEARGRGLGAYLLAQGLLRLYERKADVAAVYVDQSNVRAAELYRAAGFHHHHVDVCYTRRLGAAALPAESAEEAAA